jgi:uncharacterized protein (TIGR01244 family)
MSKFFSALLLISLALPVLAGEGGPSVLADLDQVRKEGTVAPVDGITSAGQPDEAALKVFADSGYTLVIDMRGSDEDRGVENFEGVVEGTGMSYVPFPIEDRSEISFDKAKELDALLQDADGPVLIHCASGNRVGALLALRKSLSGASDEEAIAYGKDAGMTRLEPVVRERLNED